jgi:hypothetical protein
MDERIEELFKAVLSEQGKPLGEMRRELRRHIFEAEKIVKETTEPHLDDPNNERAVQRFRQAFRVHVLRTAEHANGDTATADHLREVLKIFDELRLKGWPDDRD